MPRYAKSITPSELNAKLYAMAQKNMDGGIVPSPSEILLGAEEMIGGAKLSQDTMGKHNFENVMELSEVDPTHPLHSIIGICTIGPLTGMGFLVGQDYGMPFYIFMYVDPNNTLRGYIPSKGNAFNPLTDEPFGNNAIVFRGETDCEDDKIARFAGYKSFNDMCDQLPASAKDVYNYDLLVNDIRNRIQIK